jgi:RyR domain
MIQPTVGRVVWFYPSIGSVQAGFAAPDGGQPLAAIIARVWSDRMVNLTVFDANGVAHSRPSVRLLQEGDARDSDGYYAEWMPYQVGQAKKAEAEKAEVQYAKIDFVARVCHEVNRAYCAALGDLSQPTWEDAPAWQRESARMGVDLHLSGDFGPEASHISWMRQKLDDGWKYGPEKDAEKKEHPCIVNFVDLPREQQAKDFIFRAVVHALR